MFVLAHTSVDTVHHGVEGMDLAYGSGDCGVGRELPSSHLGGSGSGKWHSAAFSFSLVDSVQDHGPWNGVTTLKMNVPHSVTSLRNILVGTSRNVPH